MQSLNAEETKNKGSNDKVTDNISQAHIADKGNGDKRAQNQQQQHEFPHKSQEQQKEILQQQQIHVKGSHKSPLVKVPQVMFHL